LLAYLAGDAATFGRIWTFTRTEMMIRDDGLVAWSWDPTRFPRITDVNNATDGDLLIAYALALAGRAWNRPEYTAAATGLADAIGRVAIRRHGSRVILMPGAAGFGAGDRADGPVVNLSYWVFEALPV